MVTVGLHDDLLLLRIKIIRPAAANLLANRPKFIDGSSDNPVPCGKLFRQNQRPSYFVLGLGFIAAFRTTLDGRLLERSTCDTDSPYFHQCPFMPDLAISRGIVHTPCYSTLANNKGSTAAIVPDGFPSGLALSVTVLAGEKGGETEEYRYDGWP